MFCQHRHVSHSLSVHPKYCLFGAGIAGNSQPVANAIIGSGFGDQLVATINTAEHRQLFLAVADHSLMPTHPERATETKITNSLKNAGFAAAVFTEQQIDRGGKVNRGAREIAKMFCLQFNQRHKSMKSLVSGGTKKGSGLS